MRHVGCGVVKPKIQGTCRLLTWRVGGLSKQLPYRLISTRPRIWIPFRVLKHELVTHLLRPPTLQVGLEAKSPRPTLGFLAGISGFD